MIRAVVFDVGECLVDETREYGTWADWLGVPRHTFSAVFGAVFGAVIALAGWTIARRSRCSSRGSIWLRSGESGKTPARQSGSGRMTSIPTYVLL